MGNKVLEVKDINLTIGSAPILKNISFDVGQGQSIGIIGQSGAGKSMTMYAISDLLPAGSKISGEIIFNGSTDIISMKEKERRQFCSKNVAIILQDSINALTPYKKIYDQLQETILHHHDITKEECKSKIYDLMNIFGIDPDTLGKYPHQFSGGMRQRIAIALALESEAKLLIADEPTTSLDVVSQMNFIRFIHKVKEERDLSLLYISHNLGLVDMLCDYTHVMKNGEIVESGNTKELFSDPKHEYTKEMVSETRKLLSGSVREMTGHG